MHKLFQPRTTQRGIEATAGQISAIPVGYRQMLKWQGAQEDAVNK